MTRYPRRDQHGNLVPWVADWNRGLHAIMDQGLVLPDDPAEVAALGRAIADAEPPMTPERRRELDLALDQVKERNRRQYRELGLDGDQP